MNFDDQSLSAHFSSQEKQSRDHLSTAFLLLAIVNFEDCYYPLTNSYVVPMAHLNVRSRVSLRFAHFYSSLLSSLYDTLLDIATDCLFMAP